MKTTKFMIASLSILCWGITHTEETPMRMGCLVNSVTNMVSCTNCCNQAEQQSLNLSCLGIESLCPFPQVTECTLPACEVVTINLSNNKIKTIPNNAFYQFIILQYLDLSVNRICDIEKNGFSNLANLLTLNLTRNKLKQLKGKRFKDLHKLNELILNRNEIKTIDFDAFNGLDNMQILQLSCNLIKAIYREMFRNLTNLNQLILDDNFISSLDDDTFYEIYNIEIISIRNNKLTSITPTPFIGLTKLSVLDLRGNNIPQSEIDALQAALPNVDVRG